MSTLATELGTELESLDPEDALHIQRAVREMVQLARRKHAAPVSTVQHYEIKPRPLGLKPGLSYDNIGELLAQVEGEDWK